MSGVGTVHVADGKLVIQGISPTGTKTNIAVTSGGEILQSASFENLVIESPGVNTERDIFEGQIADATTLNLTFANVTTGYDILIAIDTAGGDMKLRLNGESAGNTVKGQSVFEVSGFKFTSAAIRNDSGMAVDYRIIINGV
jgi:hypothetical protein